MPWPYPRVSSIEGSEKEKARNLSNKGVSGFENITSERLKII